MDIVQTFASLVRNPAKSLDVAGWCAMRKGVP